MKEAAALWTLRLVRPGMLVGLGSGTTARYFVQGLAQKVREGLRISAVATSTETRRLAEKGGIEVADDVDRPPDLAVDGADEIDPRLNCIKGRGGAMLREKIVAHASRRFVLIADESKRVARLGAVPVPVEILPFMPEATRRSIETFGGRARLRATSAGPFITDNGNLILDASFDRVDVELGRRLDEIPGVVGHGLFFGLAKAAIFGTRDGVQVLGEPE